MASRSILTVSKSVTIAKDPVAFVQALQTQLTKQICTTDDAFPTSTSLTIKNGEPVLRRFKKQPEPDGFTLIDQLLSQRIPKCNIVDILTDTEHWLNWTKAFGPLSGFESQITSKQKRYMTTTFCYGCYLGPTQTSRSVKDFDRFQVAYVNQRHITEQNLLDANVEVINHYNRFMLPKLWGCGKRAAADGTKWDLVYREGERWKARSEISDIDVPDTIQSVLLARVDRLQAEAKHVLQCASVIGRLFKHRLLSHLTQQERNLDRYLSEFEERELVYEERTVPELEYAFKHALTQETTYQGILERRRREFHHQVAQGIERFYQERLEEYYEELAHHYSKSGDAFKAVEYLLNAGEKAKRSYANEVAIRYFKEALIHLHELGEEKATWKLSALERLGQIYALLGQHEEAISYFQTALEIRKARGDTPQSVARLCNEIALSLFWQERSDEMIQMAQEG